jgi:hypothetical protein
VSGTTGATEHAATPTALSQRAAALADAISIDWSHSLNPAGSIVDPLTKRIEGGYGRTFLAYGMLRATERDPALGLIPIVVRALLTSDGVAQAPFNLLGLAETLMRAAGNFAPAPTDIIEKAILSDPPFGSHAPTAACYQRVGCYDNLKLVNATAILATLAALPGRHGPARTTFATPATAARGALSLLSITIPRVEIADGRLEVGGTRLTGAVLSDPTRDATAYLALSAMMLGRALELAVRPPPSALRAFQRAIVALLGLTAPDGDISYMGRGQGQVWTIASAAAACALAMRLLPAQRAITSRCEGLIDTELAALTIRRSLGGVGIATVPRLTWTRGVDGYVNRTDYNGLCVYALNLTADALNGLPDPGERVLPAGTSGEQFIDAGGPGLATTSHGDIWFAVHREDSDPLDSRWGFGLMAIQKLIADTWTSTMTGRPLGPGQQGPSLILRGHDYEPIGQTMRVMPGRVVIHGGWIDGDGKHLIRPATFIYEATAQGVTLSVPVQPGDRLVVREWVGLRQPGTVTVLTPGVHQVTSRRAVAMGNASSNSLEEISHAVSTSGTGLIRVLWQG